MTEPSELKKQESAWGNKNLKKCEHCSDTGYVDGPSLSYGDLGYGDPNGSREPCPYCNAPAQEE